MQQMSDVARLRKQQTLQEQAAARALYSFASVANHRSITARMEQDAERLLGMLEEGKFEEVAQLMEYTSWALEEIPC
ncbi:MAG TPA: hypothetical protein VH593_16255, partial [Ktedonobacteraceae bacterium]